MFSETKAVFVYCLSPVHMGAGTAVGGLIDNPIQRERHTQYPLFAGSGLKGALRHDFAMQAENKKTGLISRVFGPDTGAADHAGALSFGDAQLVAFPVRCNTNAYVYATSRTALARTRRSLDIAGAPVSWPAVAAVKAGTCRLSNADLLSGENLNLESFQFKAQMNEGLREISNWLSEHALPDSDAYRFFADKLKTDLVLLHDDDFGYFVRNATNVEAHVRIDDVSGTADGGGLFYSENLPPESLLLSLVMASPERYKKGDQATDRMSGKQVMDFAIQGSDGVRGLAGRLLQIGGDATTGRGQVIMTAVTESAHE